MRRCFTMRRIAFTFSSRSLFRLEVAIIVVRAVHHGGTMEQQQPRIRIELTPAQIQQIQESSGKTVSSLEFTVEELEERIAPVTFSPASLRSDGGGSTVGR